MRQIQIGAGAVRVNAIAGDAHLFAEAGKLVAVALMIGGVQPGQEYDREFQPLAAVDSQNPHSIAARHSRLDFLRLTFFLAQIADIAGQRIDTKRLVLLQQFDPVEKTFQVRQILAGIAAVLKIVRIATVGNNACQQCRYRDILGQPTPSGELVQQAARLAPQFCRLLPGSATRCGECCRLFPIRAARRDKCLCLSLVWISCCGRCCYLPPI